MKIIPALGKVSVLLAASIAGLALADRPEKAQGQGAGIAHDDPVGGEDEIAARGGGRGRCGAHHAVLYSYSRKAPP